MKALESRDPEKIASMVESLREASLPDEPRVVREAAACLLEATGEPWIYSLSDGGFRPSGAAAADQASMREVTKLRARVQPKDRARLALAVHEACLAVLSSDRQAALTNSVCVSSFGDLGFPK